MIVPSLLKYVNEISNKYGILYVFGEDTHKGGWAGAVRDLCCGSAYREYKERE